MGARSDQEPPFEDWLLAESERLREVARQILARLARPRAAGSNDTAIQTALRFLALDPLQEAVHRTLTQTYVETGRRGAMELLADRDPEDARRLLDPGLELMMTAVHPYDVRRHQENSLA
jgi:hypothetical protein